MLTESEITFPFAVAGWTSLGVALADAGHIFYSARLIAALLVATLVPILIDRRLRR